MRLLRRDFASLVLAASLTVAGMILSPFFVPAGVLALAGLVTLPGYLFLLILGPSKLSLAERVLYSLGFSLLFIMLLGLVANIVLHGLGQPHPLAYASMLPLFTGLLGVECLAVWRLHSRGHTREPLSYELSGKKLALGGAFALIPAVAALGADVLNNRGSSLLSLIALTIVAICAVGLVVLRKHVPAWLWGWATFCLALTMLLATSLRGWFITGHDIQVEYYVFRLTDAAKLWSMSNFQDAYNACLSITILPTVLKSLTGIDGVLLYKVFYQIIFAAFTTGILVLSRRFASQAVAFAAVFVFITFPTYITDMPFLNRQEMAFGFFILLLLTIFNTNLSVGVRRIMFVLLGIGTVVSHYSTTFVAVGLLFSAYIILLAARRIPAIAVLLNPDFLVHQRRDVALRFANQHGHKAITIGAVATLVIGVILWTGVYTKTGNNITGTVTAAAKSLPTILSPKSTNNPSSPSLVKNATPQQQLAQYSTSQYQLTESTVAQAGGHYSDFASYPLINAVQKPPPLTQVGQAMSKVGASPSLIISLVKTGYGLALELMLVAAAAMSMIWRRRLGLSLDFVVLAPVAVLLLAIQVILPVIDYGLLRMMQQDMIFMSLPLVLIALEIMAWVGIRSRGTRLTILTSVFAIIFLFLSGVVNQVTGGGEAQLAVSNSGFYYDAYYTDGSDMAMYSWLAQNYPKGYPINSDRFSRVKITAHTGIVTVDGLAPADLSRDSYVVLSNANVTKDTVAMYYNGNPLFYKFPTAFLNIHKNLLYSNSDNAIYH